MALNIRSAFNIVLWRSITENLEGRQVEPYLSRVVASCLNDRYIAHGRTRYRMFKGALQDSVVSHVL